MMSKLDEVMGAISGRNRKHAQKKAAAGMGLGLALGALAGLLFAPKSGKETRADIGRAAEQGAKVVKEKTVQGAHIVSETAQDVAQLAKDKASNLKRKIKKGANKAVDTIEDIAEDAADAVNEDFEMAVECEDPHVETAEFN
ncbi:MAG: YtxH domain-containing protein [Saccharofermentanales bacterium]|jgi:gas vesicle protein